MLRGLIHVAGDNTIWDGDYQTIFPLFVISPFFSEYVEILFPCKKYHMIDRVKRGELQ